MIPGDLITLIQEVEPNNKPIIVLGVPKYGVIYTCKAIEKHYLQDRLLVQIEEFPFGYTVEGRELGVDIRFWRVVEPMDISEVIEESIQQIA